MNENLNLAKILKDCPKGTKLYSTIYGDVELVRVYIDDDTYPIEIKIGEGSDMICYTTNDGRLLDEFPGECTLFPSKDQRDWSKFMNKQSETEELCESQEITKWAYISDPLPKQSKFDPKTLQPFDKVLVKRGDKSYNVWFPDFISLPPNDVDKTVLCMTTDDVVMCIPHNNDTKHLVGTSEEAPEFYRYWED